MTMTNERASRQAATPADTGGHPQPPAPPGRLAEVMQTDVTAVTSTTPLQEVVALVLHRGLRFVPVCQNDRLVGVISNQDLVERGGLTARLDLHAALDTPAHPTLTPGRTAAEVMTTDPIAVLDGTSLHDVARLMLHRHVKRIPVLRAGHLVGVVSRYDLLAALSGVTQPGRRTRQTVTDLTAAPPAGPATCAGDVAVTGIPTLSPDTPLADVLDALLHTRLHRVVVTDPDRHVVGIVSDAGLLRRLGPHGHRLLDRLMHPTHHDPPLTGRCADVMAPTPRAVQASTPILDAIHHMISNKVKLLPVVDEQHRLVGMIDRADALRAVVDDATHPQPSSGGT
jgi:CBS domain-containing protein